MRRIEGSAGEGCDIPDKQGARQISRAPCRPETMRATCSYGVGLSPSGQTWSGPNVAARVWILVQSPEA